MVPQVGEAKTGAVIKQTDHFLGKTKLETSLNMVQKWLVCLITATVLASPTWGTTQNDPPDWGYVKLLSKNTPC